jgi:CRISPR/Cas system CSM-associated protein Csm3 (group 7 of RAMP superfamily)
MHGALRNVLRLRVEIRPDGPLLVKAGGFALDPTLPDMSFVRARLADGQEAPYLPGSSLKGVVRGFVEQTLRGWGGGAPAGWRWACPVFPDHPESCAARLGDPRLSASEVYRRSCGACRMFGHTRLRGRVAFTDAYPKEEIALEVRYGVAISRRTQAGYNPFELEVAVGGAFAGWIILENFELWQAALLAHALAAMNEGMVRVGYGKTRGLGKVRLQVEEAVLDVAGAVPNPREWPGVAGLVGPEIRKAYGLDPLQALEVPRDPDEQRAEGFLARRIWRGHEAWEAIAQALIREALRPEGGEHGGMGLAMGRG